MANTHTNYIHLFFSTQKQRITGINTKKDGKNDLEKYMATQYCTNNKHKMFAITAMPDHIHIFIGYNVKPANPGFGRKYKDLQQCLDQENRLSSSYI
jgi:REP element-mobilizing transposase RayT